MGKIWFVFLMLVSGFTHAATVTVTAGTTKSPGNFTATDDVVVTGNATFNSGTYNIKSLTVNSGVTLTVKSNTGTGVGVIINASSSVTVTGTVSADGQGFTAGGPGVSNASRGASHGGHGGYAFYDDRAVDRMPYIYGNAIEPVTLGSSANGGDYGGGAIKIVSPSMSFTGTISANGVGSYQPGSGGSIYLNVDSLSGAGTLKAIGGSSIYSGGSGGGRIAIFSNDMFYGTVNVQGGTGAAPQNWAQDTSGGSGTYIYRMKSSPNSFFCDQPTSSTVGEGVVLTSDLPKPLGDVGISSGCGLAFYGDIVSGGDITLSGSGTMRIMGNITTATSSVLFANNITVDGSSRIIADGEGYFSGSPNSGYFAGSYGGSGGDTTINGWTGNPAYPTYGTSAQPTQFGAAGANTNAPSGRGGGGIKIFVVGTLWVWGTISANAGDSLVTSGPYVGTAGSAGGSLWIHVGSLTGSGTIKAAGSNGSAGSTFIGGGGGGGRISYTAGTNSFSGTISAPGGASGGGAATAGSAGTVVNLSVGATSKLVVATQPSTAVRPSTALPVQPIFNATDSNGYITPFFADAMTIAAYTDATCTTPATGVFSGSVTTAFGTGTSQGVMYDTKGAIYIKVTSGSLTSACTQKITISDPATQLVITQQSSSTATAGANFATQPKLEARDSSGSVDGLFGGTLTMQTYSDATCTTTVSGTLNGTYSSSSGVITYSGVNFTKAGPLYIKFNSSGLTSACAALVTINAASINKIAFTTQPASTGFTTVVLTQQPIVTGQDTYGNKVTSYTSSITLAAFTNSGCTTSASGFSATTNPVSAVAGDATYAGVKFANAGTFYIKATQGARTTCSTAVVITASPVTKPPPFFRAY